MSQLLKFTPRSVKHGEPKSDDFDTRVTLIRDGQSGKCYAEAAACGESRQEAIDRIKAVDMTGFDRLEFGDSEEIPF